MKDSNSVQNHKNNDDNEGLQVIILDSSPDSKCIGIKDKRGFTHVAKIEEGKGKSRFINDACEGNK